MIISAHLILPHLEQTTHLFNLFQARSLELGLPAGYITLQCVILVTHMPTQLSRLRTELIRVPHCVLGALLFECWNVGIVTDLQCFLFVLLQR